MQLTDAEHAQVERIKVNFPTLKQKILNIKCLVFLLLCLIFSVSTLAKTPPVSPEQTVRQLYQSYSNDSKPSVFESITSARMEGAIQLNSRLTPPGDIGWFNADPICACQDYENLVLEDVNVHQPDAIHANVVVRFRPFRDGKQSVTQTLKLVAENNRWLVDDVVKDDVSIWQELNNSNQTTLSVLASLQKAQPQDFIRELFSRSNDNTWPWNAVISAQFIDTVYKYQYVISNESGDDYPEYLLNNPICDCNFDQHPEVENISIVRKKADVVRVRVHFSLDDQQHKEQDFILHRISDKWIIDDIIPSGSSSLVQRMQNVINQHKSSTETQ